MIIKRWNKKIIKLTDDGLISVSSFEESLLKRRNLIIGRNIFVTILRGIRIRLNHRFEITAVK
jgi:hypothetical protein